MKEIGKLTEQQKALLVQIRSSVPESLSVDDIMALGGKRLIEFSKSKGFKLTKRGEKAIEFIAKQ